MEFRFGLIYFWLWHVFSLTLAVESFDAPHIISNFALFSDTLTFKALELHEPFFPPNLIALVYRAYTLNLGFIGL